ncbi:MAG TPA: sigma-70 family RNA polymerase sigma factor [Bryobacteraceae bacterium]|nr:sigma-70 family RNA polymerase sigma factor [Bryobacteraceae bacterium]
MKWPVHSLLLLPLLAATMLRYPDDGNLARRLKDRDPSVVADLYDRYGRIAYTLILRIVRDRAVAEDLVQESFLRIWTRSQAFDAERGALGPWILTVARNQALDYIRSVQGRVWNSMASADSEHPNVFRDWEGDMLDGVRLKQVRSALERLNEKQRAVIELAYFEGLSHSEMAERMKEPLGSIKTWVRTALKALRDELTVAAPV